MKQAILLLLAVLLALPLPAESRYSVYKTKGSVQVCPKAEKTWSDAVRKGELQLGDRLRLGENAAITIFDGTNSLLYTYETPGECTVMEAVRSVREKAGARTGAVNAEMKRSIESHGSDPSYGVLGVSYRAQGEASYADSLAVLLRLLSATEKSGSQLLLALEREEDATVFRVRNGSEIPVYVNVLRVSGDDLTVCLEFDGREGSEGVLVDAGSEVVLEQYPFVVQEGARYLVFGTVRSYDTRSLQRALRRGGSQDALTGGFVY